MRNKYSLPDNIQEDIHRLENRKSMQLTNTQLLLLFPVVRREVEADPDNLEWRELYERLIKQVGWRMSKRGGEELRVLLQEDYQLPPLKVWGRDYE